MKKLITTIDSDLHTAVHGSLPWTKTFLSKWFLAEYDQAILELEAQQMILHLQMLLLQSETGSKDTPHNVASANSAPTAPTYIAPMAPANTAPVAPTNTAKHVFEHSPGPKSPSVQHVQKRSKDEAAFTQWKTTSSLAAYNLQRPAAPKLVPSFLSCTKVICADTIPTNFQPISIDPSADNIIAILTSDLPSLKNAPHLIRSMNAQLSFQEGEPSKNVATLLEHVQFTDPGILDLDEDNMGKGWGHYQFMAGGLNLSLLLTCWQDVGSVAIAFKLVAAAIKTCQEAQLMDVNTTTPQAGGFISDIYLERTLNCLQNCWVDTGGVLSQPCVPVIPTTLPSKTPSQCDSMMSSPVQGLKIKIKWPVNAASADNTTSHIPAGNDSTHQQPATNTEPSTSTGLDAMLLKTLQVPELQAWISSHGLVMPKSKHKDDLIVTIVSSPEFMQVTKSTIEEIIEKVRLFTVHTLA
ncbi:hypothetical protein EI94DRAFT_1794796 [Lactarius quietus]|nr:hypothetical protein EI94DRAFT_1794796 [Lactarius quietus]